MTTRVFIVFSRVLCYHSISSYDSKTGTLPPSLLPLVEIIRYSRTSTEVNGMQFTVRLPWIADPSLKTENPFMTATTCERSMLIRFAINQRLPVMENLKPEVMAKSSLLSVRGKTMATAESVFPVRLFAS